MLIFTFRMFLLLLTTMELWCLCHQTLLPPSCSYTDLWVGLPLPPSPPYPTLDTSPFFEDFLFHCHSYFYLDFDIHVDDPSNLSFFLCHSCWSYLPPHLSHSCPSHPLDFVATSKVTPTSLNSSNLLYSSLNPSHKFAAHFLHYWLQLPFLLKSLIHIFSCLVTLLLSCIHMKKPKLFKLSLYNV